MGDPAAGHFQFIEFHFCHTILQSQSISFCVTRRSRIDHGEQERISFLTPEQFFALLSHDYDTGFGAGKASAQKEILCMLAADGMPVGKIALLLQMKTETVREIMAAKQAHIEKCRKKLEQAVKQ